MKGKVKFFNAGKGFGFIAADDGKEYFVHQSGLTEGTIIRDNDDVVFDVVQGDRGPKAEKVALDTGDSSSEEEAPADEAPVEEEAPEEDAPEEEAEEDKKAA